MPTFVLIFRRAHGEVDGHDGALDVMNSCRKRKVCGREGWGEGREAEEGGKMVRRGKRKKGRGKMEERKRPHSQ